MDHLEKLASHKEWIMTLPTLEGFFPPQESSLVRSFSLFSLFKSAPVSPVKPTIDTLDPLAKACDGEEPSEKETIAALTALSSFLSRLQRCILHHECENQEATKLLAHAMEGFFQAFSLVTRIVWDSQINLARGEDMVASLESLIIGALSTYRHLTSSCDFDIEQSTEVQGIMDQCRLALLASTFPPLASAAHNHLTLLFDHSRHLVQSLQLASRPIAHSKAHPRTSLPSQAEVSDTDALHAMNLLRIFAVEMEKVDKLKALGPSKTKAQREEDSRRPLRIASEAWVLRCDLGLSMATRDIKAVKKRALKAINRDSDEEGSETEEDNVRPDMANEEDNDQEHQWEVIGETASIDCLVAARALMEVRRGGVLSDKVERHDWLERESHPLDRPSKSPIPTEVHDGNSDSDEDTTETDEESEDDDTIGAYPCPLRTLFRLHDRYEEQRLAVWLSLPQDKRSGMGTYMRGEGGKVGEAWDALGLLLLLDYDSGSLLNHGLSGEKLDKWIELASVCNSKRIRRRGRKTV